MLLTAARRRLVLIAGVTSICVLLLGVSFSLLDDELWSSSPPSVISASILPPLPPQPTEPLGNDGDDVATGAPASAANTTTDDESGTIPTSSSVFTLEDVYHVYFQKTVYEELGTYLAGALYDPAVLIEAMRTPGYMAFVDGGETRGGMPPSLSTPYAQLSDVKRATSLGLGRMHRDVSMQVLFDKSSPAELVHFDRSIRHLIRGQARQAVLKIQTIISFGPGREHLRPLFERRVELFEGHDPVWAFLSSISATSTPADIQSKWDMLGSKPKAASETPLRLHPAEQLFHIEYEILKSNPKLQKYMYTWRPTASCFEVQRECETPDGCRYYCNYAYLQNAVDPGLGGKPYYHRFLGFGGNNEYNWELSMIRYMGYEKFSVFNKVYSMTTFDCTLRQWRPPQSLTTLPVGWGGAGFCVGDSTATIGKLNFVAFSEMKQRILSSETPGRHPIVVRNKMAAAPTTTSIVPVNTEYFDEVSVLKCDIEGSEIQVLYTWSNGELRSFNNNKRLQRRINNTATSAKKQEKSVSGGGEEGSEFLMIDFSKVISEYFTVSTVLLEIHGWGPERLRLGNIAVFRTQHFLQQLTQMGYVVVSLEKNFYGDTAFELVFVHYRYFVRSEIWSHLKGKKHVMKKKKSAAAH